MCGILGIVFGRDAVMPLKALRTIANRLFLLSETRGKESSGTAILDEHAIHLLKMPYPASWMIRSDMYQSLVSRITESDYYPKVMIGHSRLVTNGSEADNRNNQPVQKSGVVGVHNGIIVNVDDLWNRFSGLDREYEVDTEIIMGLLGSKFRETGSIVDSAKYVYSLIEGTAAIAALFEGADNLLLATNNGSLYTFSNNPVGLYIFASERFILEQLASSSGLREILGDCVIIPIKPGSARLINISDSQFTDFSLKPSAQENESHVLRKHETRKIIDHSPIFRSINTRFIAVPMSRLDTSGDNPNLLYEKAKVIEGLRRCTRCILPETFPFIEFDDEGVCNYCRVRESLKQDFYHLHHGHKALDKFVEPYRKYDEPDCLVMISGGRDSCYALQYLKTVLEMNPIAYTYDWGMVTDLARRNISRICGKLGIEHVLLSADIRVKRSNVRKNVLAWLKKPDLGTIPLFMAGDKQYFYYANKVMKQNRIDLSVVCSNQYERTYFKTGFCGVKPNIGGKSDIPGIRSELDLVSYYIRRTIMNPAYINSTIIDTLFGLASYYNIPHNYLRFYDFMEWDEETIMTTLIEEYDWEKATDTTVSWRIGDGTAPFYNYIYHTMAGFTENDTFRSNQIRSGVMNREKALKIVSEENKPRHEGIKWYLTAIGLGDHFNEIIRRINSASCIK